MKKTPWTLTAVVGTAALLIAGCAGAPPAPPKKPASLPVIAPAAAPVAEAPQAKVLAEKVGPTSGNLLAASVGPVTVVVDKDTSYLSSDPVAGGDYQIVEYLGKKALKVKPNGRGEIRVAFVLDTPAKATNFKTLTYSVAGVDGAGGVYNIGLLYTEARASGERLGSFYVSDIAVAKWTDVTQNLAEQEVWGKNYPEGKSIYCLQFWTNQAKALYIADLALHP